MGGRHCFQSRILTAQVVETERAHAEFGRSALKGVGINTGEPPNLGSAETPLSCDGRRG